KVTLYAKWTECNHDSSHEYTYSLINDGTGIKKECSCKGYSETAVLFAEDTVYNRGPHPAELTYSHDSWGVNIVYAKGGLTLPAGEVPTRAGTYTASITAGGKTASVTYMIDKATQPKPAQNPVGEVKNNSIAVKPIVSSPYADTGYDENYKSEPEYRLVYYDQHGGEHTSEWVKGSIDSNGNAVVFPLDYALTNYYIYARYSECDDYYASDIVKSGAHFYPGNVRLDVICGEGVTYKDKYATAADETLTGIEIALQLEDGYYFPQNYELNLDTNKDQKAVLSTGEAYKKYNISNIPTESVLTLTIPDAKKLPTIESKIIEKEVFVNFEDKAAKISGDSAFTTYFEVKHYDSYYFNEPVLEFNSPLPKGTTLILQDRTTPSDVTYYSVTVGDATDKVSLTDFICMGTVDTHFSAETGNLKLQVAVDFSEAEAVYPVGSLNLIMGITSDDTTLTGAQSKSGTKIEISQTETAEVTEKAGFALRYANEQIVLDYTSAEGVASKWDYRHTALVLRLDSNETEMLPSDAYLLVTDRSVDGQAVITRVYKNDQKNFVVPIGAAADKNLDIALVSKTLAGGLHEFEFDATWVSNHSEADGSPSNGEVIATHGFTLKANNPVNPSLKVTTENNTKLYERSGTVNALIDWRDVKPTHEMTVTLMRKNDDTKEYASTGWSRVIEHNGVDAAVPYGLEVPLANNYSAGSYALQVTIDQGLVNVEKVNYYFIIK
ncbi:MAG: hypothetical protein IKI99_02040, partial [Firmicutes bacterium]|nr:hypothetical protein [Bacillota bacterium]